VRVVVTIRLDRRLVSSSPVSGLKMPAQTI
jgi:hypothetical protein